MSIVSMTCDAVNSCSGVGEHNSCFMFKKHTLCKHYVNKWAFLDTATKSVNAWPKWKKELAGIEVK